MLAAISLLSAFVLGGGQEAKTTHFVLHKFMQPIGEETDTFSESNGQRRTDVRFKFTDRGSAVELGANLVTDAALRPVRLEMKGRTARSTPIDLVVKVEGNRAKVSLDQNGKEESLPKGACAVHGYSPVAFQENLIRTWVAQGKPKILTTVPKGEVAIRETARDAFQLDGKTLSLRRISIRGLLWGLETAWVDDKTNLVAVMCRDAEFDHFEATRDGYEPLLSKFASLAASDAMEELARLSKGAEQRMARIVALTGGRLFDGYKVTENATVILSGGKVVATGPSTTLKIPTGSQVIDVRGKTILPGLWDMHAHFEQAEWGPTYLAAGVTTVRDCGNVFEFITSVRDAIAAGRGIGPRLLLAGLVDGDSKMALGVNRVNSAADAREQVKRYKDAGFSQMKVYSSLKLENLKALCTEAHRMGMTVTGHIPEGITLEQAVNAGMDQINHIQYFLPELRGPAKPGSNDLLDVDSLANRQKLEVYKQKGIVVDPTVALFELMLHDKAIPANQIEPGIEKLPRELQPSMASMAEGSTNPLYPRILRAFLQSIGALHRAGIPIVAGTDQSIPGYSLHRELELYVQAGLTPLEALQSATVVPAKAMGLEREAGALRPGFRADLIVVDGNPLKEIANSRKVEIVIANGRRYVPGQLWRLVGFKI